MAFDVSLFHSYTKVYTYVKLPNNQFVSAHVGSVYLKPGLLIWNVVHVPAFHFNLIH